MLAMAVTLAAKESAKSRFAHVTSPAHFSLIALVNIAAETIGQKSPLAAKFRVTFRTTRKMSMSLLQLGPVLFGGHQYFRRHGLLATTMDCSRYVILATMYFRCRSVHKIERERTDVSDGCSWYCPQCYTRKSIREKSFLAKSHLPLQKWLLLMYLWVRQYPAYEEVEVGEHTASD